MGEPVLVAGLLMTAALAASLLAGRLRIPGLLLFLAIGMLVGSDGLGWLPFDDYQLAQNVGIVALALILFEGALTTNVEQLRPVVAPAISLAVFATILTAVVTGVAASLLFGLSLEQGLLLGAIVASTDAPAIFALLRGSGLRPRLARMVEGEACGNDPVAILLVIGLIELVSTPGYGAGDMGVLFAQQVGVGLIAGLAVGSLAVQALRRLQLSQAGLYPVATLTAAAVSFGAADVLGGSGFLAVYIVGLALSAGAIPAKRTITAFHGGIAWVAQLGVFLMLGLLVFPDRLVDIWLEGLVLALVLAFVARPIASVLAALPWRMTVQERVVLGWAGLRGAVPIVLATFPVIAGIEGSSEFFDIVFFAVVVSLLLQGPTFEPLARRLGLIVAVPPTPEPIAEVGVLRGMGAEVVDYPVGEDYAVAGARVRDLGLPREAVVNVIVRGTEAIPPRGSTRLEAGDHLHILVRREVALDVERLMERWRIGPVRAPRPRRPVHGAPPIFSVRPLDAAEVQGGAGAPDAVLGREVVDVLRIRRDAEGALALLADGRYALTGELVVVGARGDLWRWMRRRARDADEDERAWLAAVGAALATEDV